MASMTTHYENMAKANRVKAKVNPVVAILPIPTCCVDDCYFCFMDLPHAKHIKYGDYQRMILECKF